MGETTSTGFWLDDERLEEFDRVASTHQEGHGYSRSQAVKNAVFMYQAILETMDDLDWDTTMAEPSKRLIVQDALRTKDSLDSADEDA